MHNFTTHCSIDMMVSALHNVSMRRVRQPWYIAYKTLTYRLGKVFAGAIFAATGIVSMHYLGVLAWKSSVSVEEDPGIVVGTICVAMVATFGK
jgi:hypothetical protein